MWYVLGSRPDGVQVKGFHPGVQLYPKVFSPKLPCLVTLPRGNGRGYPRIRVNSWYTKNSEECLSTDEATLIYEFHFYYYYLFAEEQTVQNISITDILR